MDTAAGDGGFARLPPATARLASADPGACRAWPPTAGRCPSAAGRSGRLTATLPAVMSAPRRGRGSCCAGTAWSSGSCWSGGGRFVAGLVGEQFALPEAVEALRAVRRAPEDPEPVVISSADPLNLIGILLPGERVTPASGMAIVHRNGIPVDTGPLGVLLSRLQRSGTDTTAHGRRGQPPGPDRTR